MVTVVASLLEPGGGGCNDQGWPPGNTSEYTPLLKTCGRPLTPREPGDDRKKGPVEQ